ncbi:hypothetical protein ACFX15_002576 [Malus domestica]
MQVDDRRVVVGLAAVDCTDSHYSPMTPSGTPKTHHRHTTENLNNTVRDPDKDHFGSDISPALHKTPSALASPSFSYNTHMNSEGNDRKKKSVPLTPGCPRC